MPVLREVVGDTLRSMRLRQRRTLREVSGTARVSLGYLSEVERGQKEASSELLAAICGALDVELSELFGEVATSLRREEKLAQHLRLAGEATTTPRIAPVAPDAATAGVNGAVTASVRSLPTVAA
jgi:transcriptional regulator with XRE-family HTH domain